MDILELLGPNVSPAFAQAVSRNDAYIDALKRFDWWGEFIDDGRLYRTWKASLEVLRAEQAQIDPDGSVWLSIAPKQAGVPGPMVQS